MLTKNKIICALGATALLAASSYSIASPEENYNILNPDPIKYMPYVQVKGMLSFTKA